MNEKQISYMKHAVKNGRFYTESNNKDWNELVEKGYAVKRAGWEDDMSYFIPTLEGKTKLEGYLL